MIFPWFSIFFDGLLTGADYALFMHNSLDQHNDSPCGDIEKNRTYYSFLLRLWHSNRSFQEKWRFSIEDPHTHMVITFNDIEGLTNYLTCLQTKNQPSIFHKERKEEST